MSGGVARTDGGVALREHRRVLELYAEGMAGRRVELRPTDELPDLSAHVRRDLPTASAACVFLPAEIGAFTTAARNFALYKVAVLHQLGFWECGTYSFALAEWERRRAEWAPRRTGAERGGARFGSAPGGPPFRRHAEAEEAPSDLEGFFDSFARPGLARRLFAVLEDTRVDAHLARAYRGVGEALRDVLAASLAERPDLGLLRGDRAKLEALVQASLAAQLPETPPPESSAARARDRQPSPVAARRRLVAAEGRDLEPSLLAALPRLVAAVRTVCHPRADVYVTAREVAECLPLFTGDPRGDQPASRGRAARRAPTGATKPEPITARRDGAGRATAGAGGEEEAEAVASVEPVPFRGASRPELVQKELRLAELESRLDAFPTEGSPLPPELLREMLERGELEIEGARRGESDASSGLSAADLDGLADRARSAARDRLAERVRSLAGELEEELGDLSPRPGVHYYDEWDHERSCYRRAWCRLREIRLDEEPTTELDAVRREQAALFTEVRRQFELLRPDARRILKRLTDGEDVDLDAAVEARTDRAAGVSPSEKVYMRRHRRDRDVAAAFLLDMSASTDSEIPDPEPAVSPPPARDYDFVGIYDEDPFAALGRGAPARRRRVIDVEKEALLLMTEALDALGDSYGVYGFSGYGREQVEFYVAKDFGEASERRTRARIAAIRPKRSTRMGPAIRHVSRKLRAVDARVRVLLVLSDGYPQDFDYGRDRTGRTYGIQDTMMALREAELQGIHTFCLTVDPAGQDYLREMCPERQYLVIDDVAALTRELPKVYRALTT